MKKQSSRLCLSVMDTIVLREKCNSQLNSRTGLALFPLNLCEMFIVDFANLIAIIDRKVVIRNSFDKIVQS